MSADNSLIDDHAAQAVLDRLLGSWQASGQTEPRAAPALADATARILPEPPYPPRLPSLRPTLPPVTGPRRPPASRAPGRASADAARLGEPVLEGLSPRPSFEAIADEISARASPIRPPVVEGEEEEEDLAVAQIRPDEMGPEERRFAAQIVALDAAGTLDHSVAAAAQPPIGRIGGYRFFSDEENPETEEDGEVVPNETDHLLALSAVFNANSMGFEDVSDRRPAGGPARRSFDIPSLSEDDIAEELAIKSIFL